MSHKFKVVLIIIVIHLVILALTLLIIELMPDRSSYSFKLGVLDCNNLGRLTGCQHEIGHKMDDDLGMPSLTPEFAISTQAIVQEMLISLKPNDLAIFIEVYPDKDPRELYAGIYAYVGGDISKLPHSLQQYYSGERSYSKLYDCLARTGINVCGRSVSFLT